MPIVVFRSKDVETLFGHGGTARVVECDAYGQLITDAGDAIYTWDRTELSDEGSTTPVLIAHKGECHVALERRIARRSGDRVRYGELNVLFTYLIHNTRASPKTDDIWRGASVGQALDNLGSSYRSYG
jgi:hypothetical protein